MLKLFLILIFFSFQACSPFSPEGNSRNAVNMQQKPERKAFPRDEKKSQALGISNIKATNCYMNTALKLVRQARRFHKLKKEEIKQIQERATKSHEKIETIVNQWIKIRKRTYWKY